MATVSAWLLYVLLVGAACFSVREVHYPGAQFHPAIPDHQEVVKQILGFRDFNVKSVNVGGANNDGIWFLSDPLGKHSERVIKVRTSRRPDQEPDSVQFQRFARDYPGLASDESVNFPLEVIKMRGNHGNQLAELVIMRKARGKTLSEYASMPLHSNNIEGIKDVNIVLEKVGRLLRRFHLRYNAQHGDFHTHNVFVENNHGNHILTIIDLDKMGTANQDVSYFEKNLKGAWPVWSQKLIDQFQMGYRTTPPPMPASKLHPAQPKKPSKPVLKPQPAPAPAVQPTQPPTPATKLHPAQPPAQPKKPSKPVLKPQPAPAPAPAVQPTQPPTPVSKLQPAQPMKPSNPVSKPQPTPPPTAVSTNPTDPTYYYAYYNDDSAQPTKSPVSTPPRSPQSPSLQLEKAKFDWWDELLFLMLPVAWVAVMRLPKLLPGKGLRSMVLKAGLVVALAKIWP